MTRNLTFSGAPYDLRRLPGWECCELDGAGTVLAETGERRRSPRVRLAGAELFLFREDGERLRLRVNDLSDLGVSGLIEAGVRLGESLLVQLEELLMPEAVVTWLRDGTAGLAFVAPVPLNHLSRITERHAAGAAWSPAMRAGSDLHSWWTDAGAHDAGRRAALDSDGHAHPLPR